MYIIIGATSFIGAYTVENLIYHNCDVLVTGRGTRTKEFYEKMGAKYQELELTKEEDFEKLPKENVDGVVLLAGLLPANASADLVGEENAKEYFEINTIGTINALEYCRKNNIKRLISTSSYADVYNSWSGDKALKETEPRGYKYYGDHAVYVFSKNAANDVMEYYNQQHGMSNAVFRFPPVYGVGPHGSLKINGKTVKSGLQVFIEKAQKGEDICIYGDRNLSRDVVYVKDVAEAFYLALRSEKTYGLYNMTSGVGVTLEEQAEVIAKIFADSQDKKSKITYKPEIKNNTPSYLFSMEKAFSDFGFKPAYVPFEKMMKDYKKDLDNRKFSEIFDY